MSTREGALLLLLEKLVELESNLEQTAEKQNAAAGNTRHGYDPTDGYANCAAEHRQAAAWVEVIRHEILDNLLLDRLDAEQAALRTAKAPQRPRLELVPGGAL